MLFEVKVQPRTGGADRIVGEHAGMLKLSVTAAPEKGKANAAVIALLSKEIGLPKSCIEIAHGVTSRTKTLRIRGTTKEALSTLLKRATNYTHS